jgi:hypothetical protein
MRLARRFGPALKRRGYRLNPLQDPWVGPALGLTRAQLMQEMKLLTAGGDVIGGADAMIAILRDFVRLRPLAWVARLPGLHALVVRGYRWFAERRSCSIDGCAIPQNGGRI